MPALEQTDYIDIHTHKKEPSNWFSIVNLIPGRFMDMNPGQNYSIGLHPWYLDDNFHNLMNVVEKTATNKQVLAIGETGLDKIHGPDINLQVKLFEKHIRIAESLHKPLVIHCVKSFNKVVQLKKKTKSTVPWIIHGFQSNQQIADQLLDLGIYLSFGKALITSGPRLKDMFCKVPKDQFLLETDDSEATIEEVYTAAAELRELNVLDIQQIIKSNINKCFQIDVE